MSGLSETRPLLKPSGWLPIPGGPAAHSGDPHERIPASAAPAPRSPSSLDPGPPGGCPSCASARVTGIAMTLTDGTPVEFASCHDCEHRSWSHEGGGCRSRTSSPAPPRTKVCQRCVTGRASCPTRSDLQSSRPTTSAASSRTSSTTRSPRATSARPSSALTGARAIVIGARHARVLAGWPRPSPTAPPPRVPTSSRPGSARPTCSTSPPARSTCPARCSPRATTRRSTTASSCAGPARRRSARTPGCAEIRALVEDGRPGRTTGRRARHAAGPARRLRGVPAKLVRPAPASGR